MNNKNNKIGRKLTSLTIMAIMFAGGMTIAAPSIMPEAASDFGTSDGMLSVSTEYLQGGAVLEIVVNDPDISATDAKISGGATVSIDGNSHNMNQASNGKWYLYVVDLSQSALLDADAKGMEYGVQCTTGLGVQKGIVSTGSNPAVEGVSGLANILGDDAYTIWAEALLTSGTTAYASGGSGAGGSGGCLDINNMIGVLDDVSGTTSRQLLSGAILQNAPSLSNYNDSIGNATDVDMGQRGHSLNASGYGSWPYILAVDLPSSIILEYGSDSVEVSYGNTDAQTSISLLNNSPADSTHLYLTITDPALNMDPTTADIWAFNLAAPSSHGSLFFANNGTQILGNAAITLAEMGDMGCVDNCRLANSTASAISYIGTHSSGGLSGNGGEANGLRSVIMTETSANSGVFESWALNGTSQLVTRDEVAGDKVVIFTYGGNSADMVITYNNASIEMDAGSGAFVAGDVATITVTDPDANKYPGVAETLSIGDPMSVIPTIKMGSPGTLSVGLNGTNTNLNAGDANANSGVTVGANTGTPGYTLQVNNTTDNSERLRITHSAEIACSITPFPSCVGGNAHTHTWINVTTSTTQSDLVNLPGTVVLNYDVSGPAGDLGSTAVAVYVTSGGTNSTNQPAALIDLVTSGNTRAGVADMDDDTQFLRSESVSGTYSSWGGTMSAGNDLGLFASIAFKITHPVGNFLNTTADYAIAADFCNFDQDNGSSVHNCIYRLEAVETGDDTGVFTGSFEYLLLGNATAGGTIGGEHNANEEEVEDFMTGMKGDSLVVVLMSTGDDIRVVYNDTDALQCAGGCAKIGAQVSAVSHSGTVSLDADTYGVDDMATIEIVDPDWNQDSSVRDIYQNSSRTFIVGVDDGTGNDVSKIATAPMTMIETTSNSGVFLGTFKVPDYKGKDLEVTYYESLNAAGNAIEVYDTATIVSTSGTVSFDRSVYPVPFGTDDLRKGDNSKTGQSEAGNVTMTVTVDDGDFTGDTLTTSAANTAGTILIKLIEGGTKNTCFTAGSALAGTAHTSSSTPQELGPLDEDPIGSASYAIEFTISEIQHCGTMQTVTSGDVIQVEYVDTANDAGATSTAYDSATFDLRTGTLSVDKDVYVLGSDMVVTLTDPDLNLDSGTTEAYNMSILEWDSSADSSELLNLTATFVSNPSTIQETGDDTGVFQTVVTLPTSQIASSSSIIEFGESVTLTYVDVGLSGESSTEDDVLDVEAYFSISNFGALIELDKAVYNWTDTVLFDITSPDHNTNSASEQQIGSTDLPIQISTRSGKLCVSEKTYKADETGPDTGVFSGEVQLIGFAHQMSSDADTTGTPSYTGATTCGSTATSGELVTGGQTDGVSVSFEYTDGSVVVASSSIAWNIGEASFDSSAASAGGSAVFTVVDADENLDQRIIESFTVAVYSDSDAGGFTLTLNETDESSGVFEGTVFFTSTDATSGSNLRVSEGDTITAEYVDETLPEPYTTSDDLTIAGTLTIGTAYPPLERAPAANARVVDAFGSSVAEVSVDQQVQIAAAVSNGQSSDQAFAYLVQVQDENGVTVSLAWITGSLTANQSMSPALSWTPSASGSYTATVFVWESVDNPTALSPTTSVTIDVV